MELNEKEKNKVENQVYPVIPYAPDDFSFGDYNAVKIKDYYSLVDEGNAMRHCVASYSYEMNEGDYIVYSIIDSKGKRLSTLGINFDSNDDCVVHQHYGKCNTQVTNKDVLKLADLLLIEMNRQKKE